jgi:hypothetical protein
MGGAGSSANIGAAADHGGGSVGGSSLATDATGCHSNGDECPDWSERAASAGLSSSPPVSPSSFLGRAASHRCEGGDIGAGAFEGESSTEAGAFLAAGFRRRHAGSDEEEDADAAAAGNTSSCIQQQHAKPPANSEPSVGGRVSPFLLYNLTAFD